MKKYTLRISTAFLFVIVWFGIMLFYTFLDVAVWKKIFTEFSDILNIITIGICIWVFLLLLKRTSYQIQLFSNTNFTGIILAVSCSVLFFLLLDNCLDPLFESLFPQSEQAYQETIQRLKKSPITSLIQICVLAPVIEEILMRDVILGGLKNNYGTVTALLISSVLFALLHFNMVQTLSAFVCGMVLGLLYIKTQSIFCCILAHCGYNLISFFALMGK